MMGGQSTFGVNAHNGNERGGGGYDSRNHGGEESCLCLIFVCALLWSKSHNVCLSFNLLLLLLVFIF
jgi:hypothetical protein